MKYRSLIGFLMAMIFAFPLVYQPVHLLFHHHGIPLEQFCCSGSCDLPLEKSDPGFESTQLEKGIDHCPVCEYEFTVFDDRHDEVAIRNYDHPYTPQPLFHLEYVPRFEGFNLSLRAPPNAFA